MTDRGIDIAIALNVMGWTRCGLEDYTKPAHRDSKDFPGSVIDDWDDKGPHERLVPPDCLLGEEREKAVFLCGCESHGEIPYFSSSIAAAVDVAEEMRKRGFYISIQTCHPQPSWCAIVVHDAENDERMGDVTDISLPRAMCLASLAALGVRDGA